MAPQGDHGLLPIPRRARELAATLSLPMAAALDLVASIVAPRTALSSTARPAESAGRAVDSSSPRSTSLSQGPLRCQSSEVEAVCVSRARTVLCGGCWVIDIPTATAKPSEIFSRFTGPASQNRGLTYAGDSN